MTILLIVEKNGTIKETNVKNLQLSELYKKAGFKTVEGFEQPAVCWPRPGIDPFTLDYQIQVYGKTKGRAGQENKYDFPPPIDTTLFFGSVVLVAVRPGGIVTDLTTTAWEMVYEQLFGGFEDLVDSQGNPLDDEDSEDDEEDLEGCEFTKEGYVKDDFIVDDDEGDEEYVEDTVFRKNMVVDSEDDSDFELPRTRKNKQLIKERKEKKNKKEKDKKEKTETIEAPLVKTTKSKKSKKSSPSENEEIPVVEPIIEVVSNVVDELITAEDTEEEVVKPSKKQRKPRVPKEPKAPKEPKVKKVKEPKSPKEKAEPKKKSKRGGKKDTEEVDSSEAVYVPMDTTELEEEAYV
jgi:hypothetical protein